LREIYCEKEIIFTAYANQQKILAPRAQGESASGKANNFQEMARFIINFMRCNGNHAAGANKISAKKIFRIIIKI